MFFFFFSLKLIGKSKIQRPNKIFQSFKATNTEVVSKRHPVTEAESPHGFGMKLGWCWAGRPWNGMLEWFCVGLLTTMHEHLPGAHQETCVSFVTYSVSLLPQQTQVCNRTFCFPKEYFQVPCQRRYQRQMSCISPEDSESCDVH